MSDSSHMTFQKFGRSYHLNIQTAEDLEHVLELDEARWVATGAPIKSMNCDSTFLSLVDIDGNGRIMCFEVKEAIRWLLKNLRDRRGVTDAGLSLRLNAINTDVEEGKRIHLAAVKILKQLGLPDSEEITLDQVRAAKKKVEETAVSEAGVALPEAAEDSDVRQFINDIIATVGGTPHPYGSQGVSQDRLEEFLKQAEAYLDWYAEGVIPEGQTKLDIMPLGSETRTAFELYESMCEKIDQYFALCEILEIDQRAAKHFGPSDVELQSVDFSNSQTVRELLKKSPLAVPVPDRKLRLDGQINPYYVSQLERLATEVINPVLGRSVPTLSEVEWQAVKRFFAAHEAWVGRKQGQTVEKLGPVKLKMYLDERFGNAVRKIIAESKETALVLDNIRLAEKLILYQAHLLLLVNNFVSFPHLYDPASRAVFEMGTLIMDGRHFNFSVKVENRSEHSNVAKTSNIFVLYSEILPSQSEQKYEIASPVTSGGKGNLCVGKRGVFRDIMGRQMDARVVQIIENPISISEAMVSPFKRLGNLLTGKIEAITTSSEKRLNTTVSTTLDHPETGPAAQAGKTSKGLLAGGLLMGGSVAVAALSSAVAYITNTLAGVEAYKIVVGLLAAILAVILPTSIIAMLKLRRRDLSAILEGSGWAINSRMRLTFKQGRVFTQEPELPGKTKGVLNLSLGLCE